MDKYYLHPGMRGEVPLNRCDKQVERFGHPEAQSVTWMGSERVPNGMERALRAEGRKLPSKRVGSQAKRQNERSSETLGSGTRRRGRSCGNNIRWLG